MDFPQGLLPLIRPHTVTLALTIILRWSNNDRRHSKRFPAGLFSMVALTPGGVVVLFPVNAMDLGLGRSVVCAEAKGQ